MSWTSGWAATPARGRANLRPSPLLLLHLLPDGHPTAVAGPGVGRLGNSGGLVMLLLLLLVWGLMVVLILLPRRRRRLEMRLLLLLVCHRWLRHLAVMWRGGWGPCAACTSLPIARYLTRRASGGAGLG